MNFKTAILIAYKFLNDKNLRIVKYNENDDRFLFSYEYEEIIDGVKHYSPVFDNNMIFVNKHNGKASNYRISENLDEINKLKFKDAI